jgi:polyvinyl alcohol dehydrogenase (cytochrome)
MIGVYMTVYVPVWAFRPHFEVGQIAAKATSPDGGEADGRPKEDFVAGVTKRFVRNLAQPTRWGAGAEPVRPDGREEATVGKWTAGTEAKSSKARGNLSKGLRASSILSIVTALVLITVLLPTAAVQAKRTCRANGGPGGDWPFYGRDAESTHNQTAEEEIGPENVAEVEPVWTYYTGEKGRFATNTTVVGGCLYFSDEASFGVGSVHAVDISNGKLVWKEQQDPTAKPSGGAWGSTSSVQVVDGRVHVNMNTPNGKEGLAGKSTAFDAATGERLWTSDPISFGAVANQMGAPGVWGGVHFIGLTGPDVSRAAREGFAILDAATGKTLVAHTTIPKKDYRRGYVGGGMWTNPAIDSERGYLYISTDNPNMTEQEHEYSNAILKIDINRHRSTFGDVVDSYKGDPDNFEYPMGYNNPTCKYVQPYWAELTGEDGFGSSGWSPLFCGQLDVDMGGSPTLINVKGKSGGVDLQVGGTQKSGTVHMADASDMKRLWTKTMMYPAAYQGNSGGAANDGKTMYVVSNPGVILAYDVVTGEEKWKTPMVADGLSHHPVSVANGVVYTVSNSGVMYAFDAKTGAILTTKSLHDEVRCGEGSLGDLTWSGGVVIAHNTLFASCDSSSRGGYVTAFRLPG